MYQCISFKVRSYIIQCRDGKGVHAYTDQSTESTVLLALGVYNIDGKFGHLIFGSRRKKTRCSPAAEDPEFRKQNATEIITM